MLGSTSQTTSMFNIQEEYANTNTRTQTCTDAQMNTQAFNHIAWLFLQPGCLHGKWQLCASWLGEPRRGKGASGLVACPFPVLHRQMRSLQCGSTLILTMPGGLQVRFKAHDAVNRMRLGLENKQYFAVGGKVRFDCSFAQIPFLTPMHPHTHMHTHAISPSLCAGCRLENMGLHCDRQALVQSKGSQAQQTQPQGVSRNATRFSHTHTHTHARTHARTHALCLSL